MHCDFEVLAVTPEAVLEERRRVDDWCKRAIRHSHTGIFTYMYSLRWMYRRLEVWSNKGGMHSEGGRQQSN